MPITADVPPLLLSTALLANLPKINVYSATFHPAAYRDLVADAAPWAAVPRVFDRVYNGAQQRAHAEGKGRIFDWADRTAVAYSQALDDGRPGWRLRLAHRRSDRLVYRRLRAALGGRVGYAISGGARLAPGWATSSGALASPRWKATG